VVVIGQLIAIDSRTGFDAKISRRDSPFQTNAWTVRVRAKGC
jgi:hypothetical protein